MTLFSWFGKILKLPTHRLDFKQRKEGVGNFYTNLMKFTHTEYSHIGSDIKSISDLNGWDQNECSICLIQLVTNLWWYEFDLMYGDILCWWYEIWYVVICLWWYLVWMIWYVVICLWWYLSLVLYANSFKNHITFTTSADLWKLF